jgi:hypothetical protein
MNVIVVILIATLAWFVAAFVLFFNPIIDKVYKLDEGHPSVRVLPKDPKTIGKILLAVFIQCILWALVYNWVKSSLPESFIQRGLIFGAIIIFVKIIPRDIDRLLLTTYPSKRMTIEFVVGVVCAFVVGFIYAWGL